MARGSGEFTLSAIDLPACGLMFHETILGTPCAWVEVPSWETAVSPDEIVVEQISQALLAAASQSVVSLEREDGLLWFLDIGEEEGVFAVTETTDTLRLGKELQSSLHKVGDPYESPEDTAHSVRDLVGQLYRQSVVLH